MTVIPDDLEPIIREIDEALKADGVPPHARPLRAVGAFGRRFGISVPFVPTGPGASPEIAKYSHYTRKILSWFDEMYGNRLKVDFSANAKVAVIADGDIWELRIPFVRGTLIPIVSRTLDPEDEKAISLEVRKRNPCSSLTNITPARLAKFSDADLEEVYGLFIVGLDARQSFDRFRKTHQLFVEAETDWATSTALLTAQHPNFGQSRWASLQMCERFMKGLITVIGEGDPRQRHNLSALHGELSKVIFGLDLSPLLPDLECDARVRYGEVSSNREQAYAAHKAALLLVRVLGSVSNPNAQIQS